MWKDFFYYSKSERRAILFLLVLAVVGLIVYSTCYWPQHSLARHEGAVDSAVVDSFKNQLVQREKNAHFRPKGKKRSSKSGKSYCKTLIPIRQIHSRFIN